ncbi:MAG: hypothetical protein KAJ07_00460 [Planctomycetes bacterium]|nr:hypothetical protein [Planctomycetota bacterium]
MSAEREFVAGDGEAFGSEKDLKEYEAMRERDSNTRTYVYDKETGQALLCDNAEASKKLIKTGKYVDTPAKCKGKVEQVAENTGDGKELDWLKLKAKDVKKMERTVLEEKMYYLKLMPEESMTNADMLKVIQVKLEADAETGEE